ncbi:MAG: hypothetical protein K5770_01655 [Lachnospiraceae bacterium]|nr:hypothetical protein [Lachnospiraceae bacterium]
MENMNEKEPDHTAEDIVDLYTPESRGRAIVYDDGKTLEVSYEDYGVPAFDGGDYEATYSLNSDNRKKLKTELEQEGFSGSMEEMIIGRFGEYLEKSSFALYLDEHGIKYELFTWIS